MIIEPDFVKQALQWKHGSALTGATIVAQRQAGYVSPDAEYEASLLRLVQPGIEWLDAGCGRSPCPFNPGLARHLADRAVLTGLDPGPNLPDNPYLRHAIAGGLSDCRAGPFDLVTMRMAAEHVADAAAAAAGLHRLVRPSGTLLIYTVHAGSPTVLLGRFAPLAWHRAVMRRVFGGEDRDVFRAHYRLNTPAVLLAALPGFALRRMMVLDDCRTTIGWPLLHRAELALWRLGKRVGRRYPERCIQAEFVRV